jgi:hypothetical protein
MEYRFEERLLIGISMRFFLSYFFLSYFFLSYFFLSVCVSFYDISISPPGFLRPSKIQANALPIMCPPRSSDLIGQAKNGSGKTATFTLGRRKSERPSQNNRKTATFTLGKTESERPSQNNNMTMTLILLISRIIIIIIIRSYPCILLLI